LSLNLKVKSLKKIVFNLTILSNDVAEIINNLAQKLLIKGVPVTFIASNNDMFSGKLSFKFKVKPQIVIGKDYIVVFEKISYDIDKILTSYVKTPIAIVLSPLKWRYGHNIVVVKNYNTYGKELDSYEAIINLCSNKGEMGRCKTTILRSYEDAVEWMFNKALDSLLRELPGANCGLCGYSLCKELAENVLYGREDISKCPLAIDVKLLVNNNAIRLSPYPKSVIKEVILALVRSLKGVPEDIKEVRLEVKLK